jgi:hypothetical protein
MIISTSTLTIARSTHTVWVAQVELRMLSVRRTVPGHLGNVGVIGCLTHIANLSTKWRKRRASSGFVRGQFGAGGLTTDDIIIKRKRSGGDGGRKGGMPADTGGDLLDETSEMTGGEPQAVSNSSGPLSGLEASLMVDWDSSIKTTL